MKWNQRPLGAGVPLMPPLSGEHPLCSTRRRPRSPPPADAARRIEARARDRRG